MGARRHHPGGQHAGVSTSTHRHTAGPPAPDDAGPPEPGDRASDATHRRFCRWIARGLPDQPTDEPRRLLTTLCTSERIVPSEVAAAVGAPAGTTFGRVATLLWWAHDAGDGPRCRSYRSAAMLLATAHPELLPDEPQQPHHVTAEAS